MVGCERGVEERVGRRGDGGIKVKIMITSLRLHSLTPAALPPLHLITALQGFAFCPPPHTHTNPPPNPPQRETSLQSV